MMCGGTSKVQEMTDEVKELAVSFRKAVELKTGRNFDVYEPKTFSTQVVAGMNYFIKIHVGNDKYIHLRIYQHFSGTTEFSNVLEDKADGDALEYF
ncbi:hypothetical protein SNEBB_009484 [Seison nebaliae]|nr:hypothetical protein SNEBB_009484 [Seison nebaliae]